MTLPAKVRVRVRTSASKYEPNLIRSVALFKLGNLLSVCGYDIEEENADFLIFWGVQRGES